MHVDAGTSNVNFFTGATSAAQTSGLSAGLCLLIMCVVLFFVWTLVHWGNKFRKMYLRRKEEKAMGVFLPGSDAPVSSPSSSSYPPSSPSSPSLNSPSSPSSPSAEKRALNPSQNEQYKPQVYVASRGEYRKPLPQTPNSRPVPPPRPRNKQNFYYRGSMKVKYNNNEWEQDDEDQKSNTIPEQTHSDQTTEKQTSEATLGKKKNLNDRFEMNLDNLT